MKVKEKMSNEDRDTQYFEYLKNISILGRWYRMLWVYPMIRRWSKKNILDVGCGIGAFVGTANYITGVDVNQKCVDFCKKNKLNVEFMEPDFLPFDNSSFHTVVMDNVLEHIENPNPIICEINRVLTASGRLIFLVPGRKGYLADDDHKKFYDFAELRRIADLHDYKVIKEKQLPLPFLSRIWSGFCYFVVLERS